MAIKNFGTFSKYFTQESVADIVSNLPKPTTPLMDLLFPANRRVQKASPFVSVADIQGVTGAVPLVRRDGRSVPIDPSKSTNMLVEVDPIKVSRFLSGKDVNDLISLGNAQTIKATVDENIGYLRDRVSETTEVLCRQALTGKIAYPYATEDGHGGVCEIELGKPKTLTAATLKTSSTLADIQGLFEKALTEYQAKVGSAGKPVFLLGATVYNNLITVLSGLSGGFNGYAKWTDTGLVLLGRYEIMSMALTFVLPGSSEVKSVVADNEIKIIDLANPGKLFYAALDDLEANLAPLPFFAKTWEEKDPSGVKIVGESKPLPAIAMSRVAVITVTVK